jgi:hypothetical protein
MKRATDRPKELLEILLVDKLAHLGNDNLAIADFGVCSFLLAFRVGDGDGKGVGRLELTAIEGECGLGG